MNKYISVKNISCCYGKKEVLSDISMDIDKGKILFLMGNNGSGKTTLLKCLLNNIPIQKGSILFDGKLVSDISKSDFSKMISYVPQNINLNCDLKVKDYLVLGRNPYIAFGSPTSCDYEIVEKYALQTGVLEILTQPFNSLSGGQKQWVTITRALIQEAPVLVMDEPMSALDLEKQAELLILLKRLKDEFGKTIILTSHNPNHCFCVDSIVCLLNHKHVLAFGNPKQVFTQEHIYDVYGPHILLRTDNLIEFSL